MRVTVSVGLLAATVLGADTSRTALGLRAAVAGRDNIGIGVVVPVRVRSALAFELGMDGLKYYNTDTSGAKTTSFEWSIEPAVSLILYARREWKPNVFTGVRVRYAYSDYFPRSELGIHGLLGVEYFVNPKISFFIQTGAGISYNFWTWLPCCEGLREREALHFGVDGGRVGLTIYF
jgi:hypothetical protein